MGVVMFFLFKMFIIFRLWIIIGYFIVLDFLFVVLFNLNYYWWSLLESSLNF